MNKADTRKSIIRRALEHRLIDALPDADVLAEQLADGVIAAHHSLPNWRIVLRLAEAVDSKSTHQTGVS